MYGHAFSVTESSKLGACLMTVDPRERRWIPTVPIHVQNIVVPCKLIEFYLFLRATGEDLSMCATHKQTLNGFVAEKEGRSLMTGTKRDSGWPRGGERKAASVSNVFPVVKLFGISILMSEKKNHVFSKIVIILLSL